MAIDKSRTSLGVKIVLIFVAVAMVGYLVPTLFGLFGTSGSGGGDSNTAADASAQIAQQYTMRVASNDAILRSDPTSYTALVDQGNAYFDWADAVGRAAQDNQLLLGADQPMWLAARQFYERANEIKGDNPNVGVDLAIAYFRSGETTMAIAMAEGVQKLAPTFTQAPYHLGVFYGASGDSAKAIVAFERALELDPDGQIIDTSYVQQQLQALRQAARASAPATTSP